MPNPAPMDNADVVIRLMRQKSLEDAARWMMTPNPALGGVSPDAAVAAGRKADVIAAAKAEARTGRGSAGVG